MELFNGLTEVEIYDPDIKDKLPKFMVESNDKFYLPTTRTIYHTDLKYKKYNGTNIDKIVRDNPDLSFLKNECHDTITYRKKMCKADDYTTYDLSHLELEYLEDGVFEMEHYQFTKYLFLGNNRLVFLPDLNKFQNLSVVDISNNKLTELSKMPYTLEELCCKDNYIGNIENLIKLPNLSKLDISFNKLVEIPNLKYIKIIICDNNRIDRIYPMKNLAKLSIKNNKLKELQPMMSLVDLDGDNNELRFIGNQPRLQCVFLNNNKIDKLGEMPQVETIEIKNNRVTKIPYYPGLSCLVADYKKARNFSSHYEMDKIDVFRDTVATFYFKSKQHLKMI
jgi:Leucine-rich repeat (LRR) protein